MVALSNRWLVLVASIWLQCCAGTGYVFGSLSPVIKTSLDYNQKQINRLGVAKDIGDSVGLLAGVLCDFLPTWALIFVGTVQNFVGYGWLWLIVVHRVAQPPFAVVSAFISQVLWVPVAHNFSFQGQCVAYAQMLDRCQFDPLEIASDGVNALHDACGWTGVLANSLWD